MALLSRSRRRPPTPPPARSSEGLFYVFMDELRSFWNTHPVALRPQTRAAALRSRRSWLRFTGEETNKKAHLPRGLLRRGVSFSRTPVWPMAAGLSIGP